MSTSGDNPHWDVALRLEKQALALDERVFSAMDCAVNMEQQLTKVAEACNFLCAKVERLEDEKQALQRRQAEMADERSDLRSRLTASMAVVAASSSAAEATGRELAQLKRDYELQRQRAQIDADGRKMELEACRLEVKERELSLLDARAAAKAADMRLVEMERNHSQTFGELFVAKEDLEEEFQLVSKRADQAEESETVAWKRVDEERSTRATFESRIVDSALVGLALREDVENIYREMKEVIGDLEASVFESADRMAREALQAAKTNSLLQAQMLEAVKVIAQAQTDIVAFREFTEESQNEAAVLSSQSVLQEQQLATTGMELSQMASKLGTLEARNHVLEYENSELQKRVDEDAQKQGRVERMAAESASRSNQEIAELLKERQELGAGFDEAIERTNKAEEELGEVRKQVDEMKNHLLLLESERDRCREEIAKNREEIAALSEEVAIKDEAFHMATDESMSLKQDRQLELLRRGTEASGQETMLQGFILELQSSVAATKEVHASMLISEEHHGQCCEVRTQTLEELQRQKDRTTREMEDLRERLQKAEREFHDTRRENEKLQMEMETANQRTEMAEGKMAEAVREVLKERSTRTEVERRLQHLAGLTQALNSDVKEAVLAGDSQKDVVGQLERTTEVRDKDVFLLMAELDGSESKILEQNKQIQSFKERESDAFIEIARLQSDLDTLRGDLRSKQRKLNLANIALGEAEERMRDAEARCKKATQTSEKSRQIHAKGVKIQQQLVEGLMATVQEVAESVKEVRDDLEVAEEHYGQCCEARIDCMVEMGGVKDLVCELRQSAEQAQAEIQIRTVQMCSALKEAQDELRGALIETEQLLVTSQKELQQERKTREGMEGQTTQMAGLIEQLHSDATSKTPSSTTVSRGTESQPVTVTVPMPGDKEPAQDQHSMQMALQAAERRAEETRRIILKEQAARAEVERRLRDMSALARALHADLSEVIVIQEEVAPSLMLKKQATEDVYLLMAELDASETKVAELTNRVATLQERENGSRKTMAALQESMASKQEKYAIDLAEVHQQLSETANDNKDLVARLFQAKQETFQAAREHQEASLGMTARLNEAEGALNHLEEMLKLVNDVGASQSGSTRALENECDALRDLIEESEAKRDDLQNRLVDAANRMAKLKTEIASEQQRIGEERAEWEHSRGNLMSHVERLQREIDGVRDDLHRSNMVIVQLETRSLKVDGPLASALASEEIGAVELKEIGAQMELMRNGLRTIEQRCETQDAELKESRQREKALWAEKHAMQSALKAKAAEAETLSVDLLTSLKDLDDSRGKVRGLTKELANATELARSTLDRGNTSAASVALSSLEEMLGTSNMEARKMVKKVAMLEGTCAVLKSALAQSEARGLELQNLLTEATSRISVLQNEISSERRKHDDERLLVDAEFSNCSTTLREAQSRAAALEAESRVLKEEIAALHARQYADASRGPRKAHTDIDSDMTRSTIVAPPRERGLSGRGMEVSWSPIRPDGDLGLDGDEGPGSVSRFGRGALLDREWMRSKPGESPSVVGGLDVTEHDMSWDRTRGASKEPFTMSSKSLMLRGGPHGVWDEESNMRVRLAEEKAERATMRCKELSECVQRLQDEIRLLHGAAGGRGAPDGVTAQTEKLSLDLLTALKNLDEARNEQHKSSLKLAELGRENLRLSEQLRSEEIKHQAEVEGFKTAMSHTQEVRSRANEVAAELLLQVRALQGTVKEERDFAPTEMQHTRKSQTATPGVIGVIDNQSGSPQQIAKLQGDKEQLSIKLNTLRSALQTKDQKLGVLEKCLEMASARESDLFSELHAMHVDMCSDWQAISAASARRAGGAELHLLSMIGENKLMVAEPSNTDLAKKVGDMRGVYKKVIVEMKRAHSKLISELETALGSQEYHENASSEVQDLRLQVSALKSNLVGFQSELIQSRQTHAELEKELQGAEARARALQEEAAAAKEFARSERGRSHLKEEEAEGLKTRIITLVRKVEQSRKEASSARNRSLNSNQVANRSDREIQLDLREEHLQQLQQELLVVHDNQQELKIAHEHYKEQESIWMARVSELERQLASTPSRIAADGSSSIIRAQATSEALRQQLREEKDRRDVVERRCAEEEERRKELEMELRKMEQAKAAAEVEAHGLRARMREKDQTRGRTMRVETRKSELEEEVEKLQYKLRDADSMRAVLREEAGRERTAAVNAVRQLEGVKRQLEAAKERNMELEGQLKRAGVVADELQRYCRGITELLLAVELGVMADSRNFAAMQQKVKGTAAREDDLVMQVQTLRSALHKQPVSASLEPRIVDVPLMPLSTKVSVDQMEDEHKDRVAQKKVRALESQLSELRQRELRWEETAARYKRELSAVRKELDTALDGIERVKRDKEGLERGRSAREAKLEGEIGLLEQRLRDERIRSEEKEAEILALEEKIQPLRSQNRPRREYSNRSEVGVDRTWGHGPYHSRH